MVKKSLTLLFLFISFPCLAQPLLKRTQILMGNVPVTLSIRTSPSQKLKAYTAMEKAFQKTKAIESQISEWHPESETSRLNREGSSKWVIISEDLFLILKTADEISNLTSGAFDITFPSSNPKASYRDIEYRSMPTRVHFRKRDMKIGVSSIAKGYIVDQMSLILRQEGFEDFLINAGDIYASGRWKTGIKDPKDPEHTICSVTLHNQAISTSGLYERGGHIIDPRTKHVPHENLSVTVVGSRSIMTSPLATGLFVLPKNKWPLLPSPNKIICCPGQGK